jgi:hypothetical protein
MLHEVEESVKAAQEFLRRVSTLPSDHALRRVYEYLEDMENAGYADVQVVREELKEYQFILFLKRNPSRDVNPGRRGHSFSAPVVEAF